MGLINNLKNENSEKVKKEINDISEYIAVYKKTIGKLDKLEIPEPFSDEAEIKRYFVEIYGEKGISLFERYIKNRKEYSNIEENKKFLFELLDVHKDTGIFKERVNYMEKTIKKMEETNSPKYSKILEDYFDNLDRFAENRQSVCIMGSELPELPRFLRK